MRIERQCEHMKPSATDALTTLEVTAYEPGGPCDEWVVKAYILEDGTLSVAAYWKDATGELHSTPVKLNGSENVARYSVPTL